jgi:uncharacterized protein (DUF169 family)
MIEELKSIFGSKCSAINVNGEVTEFVNIPSKQLKFCEAVNYSFDIPVKIINENLGCAGARRSLGFDTNNIQLAKNISKNNKFSLSFIMNALNSIPALQDIRHINMGLTKYMEKDSKTDLYIAYVQPGKITAIIHTLTKLNIILSVPPYSLLAVCGNVFVNSYVNRSVSISFGCPESRQYGGIAQDEIVLGLPYEIAQLIIHTNSEFKY